MPTGPIDHVVVRLQLIGHMEAWTVTGETILPSQRKARALLAVLALSAPRPASRGWLAEMLWSQRPDAGARASLRQEIHHLRDALAPANTEILQVTRHQLALRPGTVWTDVGEAMRATPGQPASLSLLSGELLEDLGGIDPAFDTWLIKQRERLHDYVRGVAEALLREQNEPDAAILAAQRLLQIDRAHEGAWRALMRASAEQGERGMAMQAYDRCRAVLADLRDAAPSAETQDLLIEIRGPLSSPLSARPRPPGPPPVATDTAVAEDQATNDKLLSGNGNLPHGGVRVGVLPMRCVGMPEEDSLLGAGFAEEITSALSRFHWMSVVSSGALMRFARDDRDGAAIRRAFGIDFLLDGRMERGGTTLRITMRLLDIRVGDQVVWARRFDHEENDLQSALDEIAAEVVAQVDPEMLLIEAKRSAAQPRMNATAYNLVLRAIPLITQFERDGFQQAGAFLAEAIVLDPDYSAAHTWYALWHVLLVGQDWAPDPREDLARAGELAERAIALDLSDAKAFAIAGLVRTFLNHDLRAAIALHEHALKLNPNHAMAWALSAISYTYLGDVKEAKRHHGRHKVLSPLDPHSFVYDANLALIHLQERDYQAAVNVGREVTQLNPSFSAGYKPYLAALGHLGRVREAEAVLRRLLSIQPNFTIERLLRTTPMEKQADRDHYAEGLRLAGVP